MNFNELRFRLSYAYVNIRYYNTVFKRKENEDDGLKRRIKTEKRKRQRRQRRQKKKRQKDRKEEKTKGLKDERTEKMKGRKRRHCPSLGLHPDFCIFHF